MQGLIGRAYGERPWRISRSDEAPSLKLGSLEDSKGRVPSPSVDSVPL